jgi:hypothetical protein
MLGSRARGSNHRSSHRQATHEDRLHRREKSVDLAQRRDGDDFANRPIAGRLSMLVRRL